jgi:recombination protein RecT
MTQLLPVQEKIKNVRALLEKSKAQIAQALPRHMDAERMLRIAMTSIQRTPKLLDCEPISLIGAVIQSSQLGLEPDGVLGHAYLIPYGTKVQFQCGYKGLLDLARRSGALSTVEARAVYEGDEFAYAYGLHPRLHHVPTTSPGTGPLTFAYAIVRLTNGGVQWDVMSRAQIDAHRARYSRASGDDSPWQTAFDEMSKKTILKRTLKLCPASIELQRAIAHDDAVDSGAPPDLAPLVAETTGVERVAPLEALTARLQAQERPAPEPAPPAPEPEPEKPEPEPVASAAPADPDGERSPVGVAEALLRVNEAARDTLTTQLRADLLRAILDAVGEWTTPPSTPLWKAICRDIAQTEDLDHADPAALHDLLRFLTQYGQGHKQAVLKFSQIARRLRLGEQREL